MRKIGCNVLYIYYISIKTWKLIGKILKKKKNSSLLIQQIQNNQFKNHCFAWTNFILFSPKKDLVDKTDFNKLVNK